MSAFSLQQSGLLPTEAVDSFMRDGFVAINALIDGTELERIRAAYDEIISARSQVSTDRMLGGITRQVMVPSMHHSTLDSNRALENARRVVSQLYGTNTANRTYDMLIDKPPLHQHATPWHQDAGYFAQPVAKVGAPIRVRSVQVWVALDDVEVANGCMQFVPGRHETVLEHRVASGDPADEGRLIELVDPPGQLDLATAVAAPLLAGGCTMHLAGTPHYTGPNITNDRHRRAYIFNLDPTDDVNSDVEAKLRAAYAERIAAEHAKR